MTDAKMFLVFGTIVGILLILDLGVFNRHGKEPTLKAALGWSAFWIAISLGFNAWVYAQRGPDDGTKWLTGYLLEKALSVDNLFVISVTFTYFKIPRALQHRVLFWGVFGAIVTRGVAIAAGVEILHRFRWASYAMGLFLIYTAFKLMMPEHGDEELGDNRVIRLARRVWRFTDQLRGEHFFVREAGKWTATPLFLVLLVVETSDIVFAVDSIPAILGITHDAFIVYTSNVFAVLGLRALYFVLADAVLRFHYMKHGLSVILGFVGFKMLLESVYDVPVEWSLGFIVAVLIGSGVASTIRQRRLTEERERWQEQHARPSVRSEPPFELLPELLAASPPSGPITPVERLMVLHQLPMFRGASFEDLRDVADDLYILQFPPGERIFQEGDDGDALYIVLNGQVGIYHTKDGVEVRVATLGPREYFGEMAIFDNAPRSASVMALTDTTVLALARDAFQRLGVIRPSVLLEVIRVLAERLRKADKDVADLTRAGSKGERSALGDR